MLFVIFIFGITRYFILFDWLVRLFRATSEKKSFCKSQLEIYGQSLETNGCSPQCSGATQIHETFGVEIDQIFISPGAL